MPLVDTILASCKDVVQLNEGGQRKVFRAIHPEYGTVVVKYSKHNDSSVVERLTREAAFLESVESPCLARVYQIVVEPATQECVIVEGFIEGEELAHRMGDFSSEAAIVLFVRDLVKCLRVVWDNRIVHRDLKPRNILIGSEGKPKVVDFGIARFLDQDSITDSYLGAPATPWYAAPEQLQYRKADIDKRTDFFAVGIIALELRIGQHPFDPKLVGGNSIPHNIVTGNYQDPGTVPGTSASFVRLIKRLLQTQPYLRFRDETDILNFLEENWSDLL